MPTLDINKPVRYNGRPAHIVHTNYKSSFAPGHPLLVVVDNPDGSNQVYAFRLDGTRVTDHRVLENVPERTSFFVNVWKGEGDKPFVSPYTCHSLAEARNISCSADRRLYIMEHIFEGDKFVETVTHNA